MFYNSNNSILLFSSNSQKVVATFKTNISQKRIQLLINTGKKRKNSKLVTYTIKNTTYKKLFDINSGYVWFNNNCPSRGPLYNDFRFADIETNAVHYTITPKSGHSGKAEVWCRENDFEKALVCGTMRDVYKFFGV